MRRLLPVVAVAILCGLGIYGIHYRRSASGRYLASLNAQKERLSVKEIDVRKLRSEGAMALRRFFGYWRDRRFDQMEAMLIEEPGKHSIPFEQAMAQSPVSWFEVEILDDEPTDQGWLVSFRIKVTSPESLYAAVVISTNALVLGQRKVAESVLVPPLTLGIETYATFEQKWLVKTVGSAQKVDTLPPGGGPSLDLLAYVRSLERMQRPSKNGRYYRSSFTYEIALWLESVTNLLGLDPSDTSIVRKADPLFERAKANLQFADKAPGGN